MSDTPKTFDPYPWNQYGQGRSHRPEVMYPCDDGVWVNLYDYRTLERQRDAYAETLRDIAKVGHDWERNYIRERHPELGNSPALPPTVGSGEGSTNQAP